MVILNEILSSQAIKNNNEKVIIIDGLRGIAILMVIYQHLFAASVINRLGTGILFGYGFLGVNLFFILSGFVLYMPYLEGRRSFDSASDIFTFYKKRFLRLYPLLVVNVFVLSVFYNKFDLAYIKSSLMVLTTLSQFSAAEFFPLINGLLWSLVVEIMFSAIFPFLVIAVRKFKLNKVAILVFVLAFSLRLVGAGIVFSQPHLNPVKDFFLARLDDFVLGMLIATIFVKAPKFIKRFRGFPVFIGGLAVFILSTWVWELYLQNRSLTILAAVANNVIQLAFFLIILYAFNTNIINQILSLKPIRILGIMCYSIYIWHLVLAVIIIRQNRIEDYLIYFAVTICLAVFSFKFVERGNFNLK